jgi:hypothetical protein
MDMDEGLNSFMEYMAEQELELIFLLDVDQLRILFLTCNRS